ncbi:2-C-methyl-D-erythritol 2,4-cyclodiphosphate synthase [Salinibacter altiplanensis]|uniref:2-C-methyl-D-erythritol 2,4-cyclodiphosphate synthase n=1 Tax=Salinibacter altiplanensis TaxID=1803181 RepID=UPI000C9F2F72|nr:2-C-methyl-D-erythritol 2,4-cyclodiphosphate synthase [Salinibacter altiplanensis]
MRIGFGYDVHRLVEGHSLILGGKKIPYEQGLAGHSDADVLLHAVADALLGAAALGDLGAHFPDTDAEWEGADSQVLLRQVTQKIHDAGYIPHNVDGTVLLERPKLRPHVDEMRANIATALSCSRDQVSVKATTTEGVGFVGREEGVAVQAVCTIQPAQRERS